VEKGQKTKASSLPWFSLFEEGKKSYFYGSFPGLAYEQLERIFFFYMPHVDLHLMRTSSNKYKVTSWPIFSYKLKKLKKKGWRRGELQPDQKITHAI
jgi:hypothetical protein